MYIYIKRYRVNGGYRLRFFLKALKDIHYWKQKNLEKKIRLHFDLVSRMIDFFFCFTKGICKTTCIPKNHILSIQMLCNDTDMTDAKGVPY